MKYINRDKWHCPRCDVKLTLDGSVIDCGFSVELGSSCPKCNENWSIED